MSDPRCECFARTFWEGRCDWCRENPEVLPPLDYQEVSRNMHIEFEKFFDDLVTQAAIELGVAAGKYVSEACRNSENL